MKIGRILQSGVGIITAALLLPLSVFPCSCKVPPVCLAYSAAESVFIGKLVDVGVRPPFPEPQYAAFAVVESLKGTLDRSRKVIFEQDYCLNRQFLIGEMYLVYTDAAGSVRLCNRTELLDFRRSDLDYIKGLSAAKPSFLIAGLVSISEEIELGEIKLRINDGKKSVRPSFDKSGRFSYTTSKVGKYFVEIRLPFRAHVEAFSGMRLFPDLAVVRSGGETKISYLVDFIPNSCDSRDFDIRVLP